jgi:tRNA 2-thiouridine synthesizing protein E
MRSFVGQWLRERSEPGALNRLQYWSVITAYGLAAAEGLKLTDAHFEVIAFLRDRYRAHGRLVPAHVLSQELDQAFADRGGLRYLYRLFPRGPVHQAMRIAGLPLPAQTVDNSFGTVH